LVYFAPPDQIHLAKAANFAYKSIKPMNSTLDRIDAQIAARHLLTHPFYLAWTRGELRRETLADYAGQYYKHVAAFPTYLSALHAGCDDQPTRRHILQNLIDEEAGDPNHPQLWRDFAASLGVTSDHLDQIESWPETANLIATFREICTQGDLAEGLAALYAYESQIPAVSESKIDGLVRRYDFNNPESYRYFTVHIEADKEHSAVERKLLAANVSSENQERVTAAVDRALDALWELLSGVCRRHAIAC
jgi:pyrroloquinoline-quinone synthase